MFESLDQTDAAAEFRTAALPPLIAFIAAQFYFALYPLLTRVPPALFWIVDAIALAGAVLGLRGLLRAIIRHRRALDARAIGWMIVCIAAIVLSARLFLSLTFPWL